MEDTRKVVIIGSGAAGYTAGIYAARANLKPLLFAGANMGGQLMITTHVENFPGFAEPILGPDLMERMKKQCERLGVDIVPENVARLDLSRRPFAVESTEGTKALADTVILATGAKAKLLDLESESRLMGHGVSACATCDGFFFKGKEILVVGGGDTAMEEATFLTKFATKVTVVHRRGVLRASKIMQDRAKNNPKIHWIWNSTIDEVLGSEMVEGVKLRNILSGETTAMKTQGVFIAIGHEPASQLVKGQLELLETGYVKTDGRARTSVPGVFAAGDVMDPHYRQAITAAGAGCMAALEAERFLASREAVTA